jgi:hypothetical protein
MRMLLVALPLLIVFAGISVDRAMALLDLKDKREWADFASQESIVVDASGGIDAKETQVRRVFALLRGARCDPRVLLCSKHARPNKRPSMKAKGDRPG